MEKETTPISNKKQEKLERYDARGVQTLFRTLSRNHYNLLKMVDNKARIVLTVNSIITSLLMGLLFVIPKSRQVPLEFGVRILVVCSMLSMIFALFSMLPYRYFGSVYKKSGYRGTLYAENFSKLSLDEFKDEFERIMMRGQNVYDEMIADLYFLGKSIVRKQKLLYISVIIFLIGLASAIIYSLINGLVEFA
ncbi:MAG TPA: Pycsar system effector family protein [Aequorivita sp.]|nr:Pycsar system effector family protein [Aequorivita sp.]